MIRVYRCRFASITKPVLPLIASTICRATQILRSSKHRMKDESTDEARFDAALAHGLARVALGLNIAIHGYTRLPNLAGFANGMVKQFAATFLPGPLVYITGFGIAIGEAVIGTLLFFGLLCRPVLVFGTLLMLLIDLRRRAHSAVGNSFGPNDICCVLLRIACNSSLRSFFSGRLTSAQIDEYIRSADSPLGEIDHVILSELSGRILSAIFGTRS
jgi:uncharacterized membrane protein YphA (DoxX/SURF4 family)